MWIRQRHATDYRIFFADIPEYALYCTEILYRLVIHV